METGQLGIFANGYWGHPAYKLPPEANLMAVAHYLEALAWQREVARLHTIFGGKNPHPNFVVGGVGSPIDLNSDSAINSKRLAEVQSHHLDHGVRSWTRSMSPTPWPSPASTRTGAAAARAWATSCATATCRRPGWPGATPSCCSRAGSSSTATSARSTRWTCTTTARSRSSSPTPGTTTRAARTRACTPMPARPRFNYDGRGGVKPPYTQLNVDDGYSWLKAPRWKGHSVEVGPLARVLMMYATGHEQTKELVNMTLSKLDVPVTALFSTLGRTAARTLETKVVADSMQGWFNNLIANIKQGDTQTFNEALWDPSTWPRHAKGAGFMEAPRGALGHWIVIDNGKIENYQAVVPTTWNAGPRDPKGVPGAYEAALAAQPPAGRCQPAAGDPADHPLLRPLHRLRRPPHGPGDRRQDRGQGDLTLPGSCSRAGGGTRRPLQEAAPDNTGRPSSLACPFGPAERLRANLPGLAHPIYGKKRLAAGARKSGSHRGPPNNNASPCRPRPPAPRAAATGLSRAIPKEQPMQNPTSPVYKRLTWLLLLVVIGLYALHLWHSGTAQGQRGQPEGRPHRERPAPD